MFVERVIFRRFSKFLERDLYEYIMYMYMDDMRWFKIIISLARAFQRDLMIFFLVRKYIFFRHYYVRFIGQHEHAINFATINAQILQQTFNLYPFGLLD